MALNKGKNIMNIPYGYCQCGCGGKTNLIQDDGHKRKSLIGTPRKYIFGHAHIGEKAELNHNWKGGRSKDRKGYVIIYVKDHLGISINGYMREHIVLCENVLGKSLPEKAVIHHANEIKDDNILSNLVICPDEAYHQLLHKRIRAFAACGDYDKRKCQYCKQYDNQSNLVMRGNSSTFHHSCYTSYLRNHSKFLKEVTNQRQNSQSPQIY